MRAARYNGIVSEFSKADVFMNMKLRMWLRQTLWAGIAIGLCVAGIPAQDLSSEFGAKIDSLIVNAYQTAVEEFPCKPGTGGNPRMIDWKDLEKCLNGADDRVDWNGLAGQIETLRQDQGVPREDVTGIVESALSAHAIPYDRVLTVKKKDALLPLSNTVLKFLPEESLKGLPVYDRRLKKQIGTFFSSFTYEKSGGLSAANNYKLSLFQYTDLKGDLQAPMLNNRLLLDSYGVPWADASSRPGFRLTSNRLGFKY
jgi:hypothetical protein